MYWRSNQGYRPTARTPEKVSMLYIPQEIQLRNINKPTGLKSYEATTPLPLIHTFTNLFLFLNNKN